ncbi:MULTISPECIES: BON domain-containing protein [Pseudomonas]|uniref:BON domain-containing protein n=1 Tax=Pseudomonas quercus TaxID=2722792 RepID=A0ABX0YI53_9PSED|nr:MULTISPECIES: BON domain-containing protein [Pseudomonas]MBF7144458.1 BON domain-containing protein [Pseudomonas sp. LY10J]NJP02997.1 BON domain-containing protein [Pseudomonas quercus]
MTHSRLNLTRTLAALMLCSAGIAQADPVTDARKEGAANMALSLNERLASDNIKVKVTDAKAIVTGKVASEDDKQLAAQITTAVTDVTAVENRLVVDAALEEQPLAKPAQLITLEDLTLATTLRARFSWSTPTMGSPLDVRVEGGVVTLRGQAATAQAKEWAGVLATNTKGVIVVNNLIGLRASDAKTTEAEVQVRSPDERVTDAWIASRVANSFNYDRGLDALRLVVKVADGVVSLSGEADSQAHKAHAVAITRQIRGVRGVDADLLRVASTAASIEG